MTAAAPVRRRVVTAVGLLALVVVTGLLAAAVLRDRAAFTAAVDRIGWARAGGSTLLAVGGVAATQRVWVCSLAAVSAALPAATAVPTYFVGQLGKYLPGSVWPTVLQVEAGHRAGVRRATMLTAGALSLLVGLAVGAAVACVLLPLAGPEALRRFFWLLLALPALLALLHPRVLPAVVDRVFTALRREPPGQQLRTAPLLRAAAWSLLSWLLLGAHAGVLVAGLDVPTAGALLLGTGALALAVTVGILAVPLPAGAGLREAALLVALAPVLATGEGLAVAVVSRVELVVVDVALAGLAALLLLRSPAPARGPA